MMAFVPHLIYNMSLNNFNQSYMWHIYDFSIEDTYLDDGSPILLRVLWVLSQSQEIKSILQRIFLTLKDFLKKLDFLRFIALFSNSKAWCLFLVRSRILSLIFSKQIYLHSRKSNRMTIHKIPLKFVNLISISKLIIFLEPFVNRIEKVLSREILFTKWEQDVFIQKKIFLFT